MRHSLCVYCVCGQKRSEVKWSEWIQNKILTTVINLFVCVSTLWPMRTLLLITRVHFVFHFALPLTPLSFRTYVLRVWGLLSSSICPFYYCISHSWLYSLFVCVCERSFISFREAAAAIQWMTNPLISFEPISFGTERQKEPALKPREF